MGYQFIHLECYSRTTPKKGKQGGHNIATILAEAGRIEGACPHVPNPQPPTLLYGVPLSQVEDDVHAWAVQSTDSRGHKLRADALCLLGGVVSVPDDLEDWDGYKQRAIEWLVARYGERLRSCVEHREEAHRHLHFYAAALPGERFETLHDGRKAAADAKSMGRVKGEQNNAYKAAMRGFQRDFYGMSQRFGLLPIGPGRRRLTREQWNAELQQAKAVEAARLRAKRIDARSTAEAGRIIEEAQAAAAAVAGWGNRFGLFFDSARETFSGVTAKLQAQIVGMAAKIEHHSSQAKRIRREREAVKQELEEQAKAARLQLEAEQSRRQKAERRTAQLELDLAEAKNPSTPSPTFNGAGLKRKN